VRQKSIEPFESPEKSSLYVEWSNGPDYVSPEDTMDERKAASRQLAWCSGGVIVALVFSGALTTARHSEADAPFQDVTSRQPALEFEVISIRSAERPTAPPGNSLRTLPGGRFEVNAVSLQAIILWAYELRPYADTLEGSSELLKQHFTISAKAPTDVSLPDQDGVFPAMARAMLRDRFQLKVSLQQEPRDVSVLRRLRADALGDGLKRLEGDCAGRQPKGSDITTPLLKCSLNYIDGRLTGIVGQMSELADFLTRITQRPFVDATGLTGKFEISSTSDPASLMTVRGDALKSPGPYPGSNYDSFNTALEKQLGLTVKRERMPMKKLVVESVTAPTDN